MALQQLNAYVKALVTNSGILRRRLRRRFWNLAPPGLHRYSEVVGEFSNHLYIQSLTDSLSQLLDRAGVEHLILDTHVLHEPQVAVDRANRIKLIRALRRDPASARWWLAISRHGPIGRPSPVQGRFRWTVGATGIMVTRNLVSATGTPLTNSEGGVLVSFWDRLSVDTGTTGGGILVRDTLVAPKPNGVLDQAQPSLWRAAQASGHRLPRDCPHLLVVNEPIDIVYTWVDGADPAWLARKARVREGRSDDLPLDAAITARFQNRDELRYSLRSVQMFADWVHRIWIVTDRQVPSWLAQDSRLRIVDHSEIFSDQSALPVFNSHAIESQLHHINGLASHYIYMNDDVLFGVPAKPEDFFHGDRLLKIFTSSTMIDIGNHLPDDLAVTAAAKNNRDFIEATFGRTISNKLRHTPHAQLRDVMEEFESRYPQVFDSVMRSRFRSKIDYALCSSLGQYYAFATRRAVTGRITNGYVDLASDDAGYVLREWIRTRGWQVLCLNDSGTGDPATADTRDELLREFLDAYYPLPSRWERGEGQVTLL